MVFALLNISIIYMLVCLLRSGEGAWQGRGGHCMCARARRVGGLGVQGVQGEPGQITLDCAQLSFFSCRTRSQLQMAQAKGSLEPRLEGICASRGACGGQNTFFNTFSFAAD